MTSIAVTKIFGEKYSEIEFFGEDSQVFEDRLAVILDEALKKFLHDNEFSLDSLNKVEVNQKMGDMFIYKKSNNMDS